MLTFAVTSAGRTLLKLCGMILCFAALTGIFQAAGLFRCCTALMQQLGVSFPLADLVRSILEISNCVELPLPVPLRIPVLAGLLSFGGVCVLLQPFPSESWSGHGALPDCSPAASVLLYCIFSRLLYRSRC